MSDRTPTPASASATTATYNTLNQLAIAGCTVASGCYDKNGNLLNDGTRTFSYDNEGDGRILSATNGSTTASYGYNPDGQRVSKTVNGTTTTYALDAAGHEVAEISGGQIQHFYLYSPSGTAPVALVDGAGNISFNHVDNLGSVVGTTSNSQVTGTVNYTPYGAVIGSLSGMAFGYAGYRYDAETGLYHTATRSYDPNLGRFIQTDPIGYAGGRNTYAYTGGNPLNATDAKGTDQEEEDEDGGGGDGAGGGAGGGCNCLAGQSGDGFGGEDPGGGGYYNSPGGEFGAAHTITVTDYGDGYTTSTNGLGELVQASFGPSSSGVPTLATVALMAPDEDEDPAEAESQAYELGQNIAKAVSPDTSTPLPAAPPAPVSSLYGPELAAIGIETPDTTTVGRYMSQTELDAMMESGYVQESSNNGVTSVTVPPNSGLYRAGPTSDIFTTFDVPTASLNAVGIGTAKIYGPNSIFGSRLGITAMPPATNIRIPR